MMWRGELRGFSSRDAIYPQHLSDGVLDRDGFLVSSLALTL